MVPPPLAFAVFTAAIRPAAPPPGPEHRTMPTLEARAAEPPRTATAAAATAATPACHTHVTEASRLPTPGRQSRGPKCARPACTDQARPPLPAILANGSR